MLKVIALMAGGIFLTAAGIYFLSVANLSEFVFPFFNFQLPILNINWAIVGFVTIVGSIAILGSAFVVNKLFA